MQARQKVLCRKLLGACFRLRKAAYGAYSHRDSARTFGDVWRNTTLLHQERKQQRALSAVALLDTRKSIDAFAIVYCMTVSEAQRLKALEAENSKLKRLPTEAMLDNAALKGVVGRKW